MFVFLVLLWVARVSGSNLKDMRSAVAATQLILAQQAQLFKGVLNATDYDCCHQEAVHRTAMEKECPFPYANFMGECFYASKYKLKWHDARKHCLDMSGDLAVPTKLYALKTYVIEERVSRSTWIGGLGEEDGSGWHWVTGQPIDDEDWALGNPGTNPNTPQCLELTRNRHPPLKSKSCSTALKFICQYN
ncbi:lithostathine-1-like [Penaeus monodon]|uniref:lithostathine-1-like n=1 Tax=Penaeus monodon TaxID=6687 RepID=UPI0018A7C66E|nr:lithostathine-1-like [Penaeus monodon]